MQVGVAGASGYAGGEVLRVLASHPHLEVAVVTADRVAGARIAAHAPSLAAAYPTMAMEATDAAAFAGCELVFVALPHGRSAPLVEALLATGIRVVDLGADFRLADQAVWDEWYREPHGAPSLLGSAVYGLVERHRAALPRASLVAVPGCYPTATILALGPFLDAGVVERERIVVDALSGASGAGRGLSDQLHFATLVDDAAAYGLLDHRHTAEMQQELGASLLFTPHLVPIDRGLVATAYARVAAPLRTADAIELLHATYADEPFVVVTDHPPAPKSVRGTNVAHVTACVDQRTGWLVAIGAIDNLGKGAAGQAVQCANVVCGIDETSGLALAGVWP